VKQLTSSILRMQPRARRAFIIAMDVFMVLLSIPLSLSLSLSRLSFDPFSTMGLTVWALVGLFSHVLFRFGGLYGTVWRFASTPDFFNIISNCAILTVGLYLGSQIARWFSPMSGLNERQFIVFFLVTFALISAPRLVYRYLREGTGWSIGGRRNEAAGQRRALFVGQLEDADHIIRFTNTEREKTQIVGIVATEALAHAGDQIRGVPVVAVWPDVSGILEDYAKDTKRVNLLIFGSGGQSEMNKFSELVRVARKLGIEVLQFSGFSKLRGGAALVLQTVEMETILRRTAVPTDIARIGAFVRGKRVLVTGGAGSIGRNLVRRSLELGSKAVLVADQSEFGIFQLQQTISGQFQGRLTCRIVDVCDKAQFTRVVEEFRPDIIFHAAALKHVPLLEDNWMSAIKTNVFGTLACAEVASECKVPHFVLISSDKAADPSSVLGLTKRMAEQIVNSLHFSERLRQTDNALKPVFISVRFGNVFGSDGSVATVFEKQIMAGGPVTITDRAMTRYFMTMGEAVDLVIMAAAESATRRDIDNFGIYMLDMGQPVSILTVAETMIRLAGKQPHQDIQIEITGVRPGEKLEETLCAEGEQLVSLTVNSLFGLKTGLFGWQEIRRALAELRSAAESYDKDEAISVLQSVYRTVDESAPEAAEVVPLKVAT
jgi:FlaA1/EpsC-like NDP-sugar epimerase